ncbi:hypothetical protein F2P81_002618 [Scophthalmus maximus]|uniref:[histone H4]-lysine(20) N-methyltransferase n=1 Tax=Scophthalmus maximus TaxID=52904 RepID=A0A6A4TMM2_SCOMX|nr:hypothetical protein F2P81_002618 [Scophthalmus maximus]
MSQSPPQQQRQRSPRPTEERSPPQGRRKEATAKNVQHIEGKGRAVFATRCFQKGEYVVEYHGDLLQITDANMREAEYAQNPATGCYMYYFQYLCKTYCVDATKETGRMGRLINHSKNGNCQTKLHDINGIPHLILVASRDIDEGEELLYDYGDRSKASIAAHPKEKRVAIITLRNESQSVRKIGKTLKVSPSAVAKTIKRYKETCSHEDRPRKGRPRVISAAEDKFIRVTSLRNRRLTAAQIRDQVNATQSSSSRHISRTTVKRRLCESDLHGRIAARKPLLRTGNKQKRLVWAKEHKEWTLDQWKSLLWSDESKFEIFGSNHCVFVRRRKGERMDSTCLVPTVKHGGGGVMVWGCFAGDTVGDLFKIEGILNQHGYHSILQRHAIPFGLRVVGTSFIFQQDNDPKHTSRLCKGYLTKNEFSVFGCETFRLLA